MSKIAVCSIHPDATIHVTTRQGRKVNVYFEKKQGPNGPIGYAEVDEDVAARLLPIKKEYWKPGDGPAPLPDVAISQALAADPVARAAAERLLGGRSPEDVLSEIDDLKAKVAALEGGEKKTSNIEKAQAAKKVKKQLTDAIEAINLAETDAEIDAITTGLPENEELTAAVAARKATLAE